MKKLLLLSIVALALPVLAGTDTNSPAIVKYRSVIVQCIKDGKKDFSANDKAKAQIIAEEAVKQGYKITIKKLDDGVQVFLSK